MTPGSGKSRGDARADARGTRAVANECLDALCRGDAAGARKLVKASAADCPGLAGEIRALRGAVSGLGIPPAAPDLSASILDQLDASRGFLPRRERRHLSMSRVALACGLVLSGAGIAVFHRLSPTPPAPAPINMIAEGMPMDAAATRAAVVGTLGSIEDNVAGSIAGLLSRPTGRVYALSPERIGNSALAIGDTSRYDSHASSLMTFEWRMDQGSGALALLPFPSAHRAIAASELERARPLPLGFDPLLSVPTTATVLKRNPLVLEEDSEAGAETEKDSSRGDEGKK